MTNPSLKIEAGKYYRTRSGRKAFVSVIMKNPFQGNDEIYILYVDILTDTDK